MTVRAHSVNKDLLRWARVTSGLTVEQVAESLGRPVAVIESWESGEATPTYRQLEALAHDLFKRPVAVFFFPEPPAEAPMQGRFRTLPAEEYALLEADTLYAMREARSRQLMLPELTVGLERRGPPLPTQLRATPSGSVTRLAAGVRAAIGIDIDVQRRWRSADEALKAWREAVESVGVYVFKRSFEQADVSGFCLDDETFPVIVINNGTAHTRQIFTLFHELGHLLFGVSGVTTREQRYLGSLEGEARDTEIACNRFASELLVPDEAFPWQLFERPDLDRIVSQVASMFRVSREVILRRLLDHGRVSEASYLEKVHEWRRDYFRDDRGGGGSYYANLGTYLSGAFLTAALFQYHSGHLSIGDLADKLGMKAQRVARFEDFLLSHR
jgi:Zn-dependent peptidase ImmA (M78 family)/transcriptional regulator with XRE-family HTH domain